MNLRNTGAEWRHKLRLTFMDRRSPGSNPPQRGPVGLSEHELRRLVAAMVD